MSDADEKLREWPWQQYGSAVAVEDELIGYAANEGQAGNFVTAHNAVLAERDQARQALQEIGAYMQRQAVSARAVGSGKRERIMLDGLAILERAALAGPVGVPAEQSQKCNCGHLRSDHFTNEPSSCRFSACHCGSFGPVAEPSGVPVPAEQPSQGHRLSTARVGERVEAVLKGTLIAYDPDSGHWTLETDGTDHVSWRIELHWSQPFRPVAEPLVADPPEATA